MSSQSFNVDSQSQSAFRSQFICAGAGAGKTTKLIKTFLEFVKEFKLKNKRYPRVVMTTFTRKATQEVKERLLVTALNANEKEIFEYINKKSFVHISTIHGLLSIFLTQYAEKMKFPQEIKIIDDLQHDKLLKKIINDLLKKSPEYMELLEQYSFLQLVALSGEALNFASQGKKFNFVQKKELEQIAKQRKSEIIEAIDKVFSLVKNAPANWNEYFTFLKNAADFLRNNNEEGFFRVLENTPSKPRWSNAKPPFEPLAHDIIEDIKNNKLTDLFDTENFISKHQTLNSLFFKLINELSENMILHKRNTGELTIADLENLSLNLLEQYPETAIDFSDSWDYFMVDEYQDTSPLQVRILNQIIGDKPCFIVGDPQQSIYLFRGARSEVFEEKLKEMQTKKAEILFLETNYRSEPGLMRFINEYFSHFSQQFKAMLIKTQTEENNSLHKLQQDAFFIKSTSQVEATLSHIESLMKQGINPQDICVLSRSNKKLMDIAIKANNRAIPVQLQSAAGFEEKREILDLIAFLKFLNNPHDDENLVMLLRSPWFFLDDEIILQLAQSPLARNNSLWSALRNSDVALNVALKESLIKFLLLNDTVGCLQATKSFISEKQFVLFSEFYDKTGKREANIFKFLISLAQAEKGLGFSLGLFLDEQFQSLQTDLGSSNSEAQPVIQPNCVSLMTVHAAKGLQFKHVIVIGFADSPTLSNTKKISFDDVTQKFSLSVLNDETSKHQASGWATDIKTKFNQRELLENERVLYVAMTWAIESLSLVVEIDKRMPTEKSWYKKSNWPLEVGEIAGDGYRAVSLSYTEASIPKIIDQNKKIKARSKFSETNQVSTDMKSVTELISEDNKKTNTVNLENILINLKKAQKGSDLHRIFESLKYLGPNVLLKNLSEADQKNVSYLLEQKDLDLLNILQHGQSEWGFGLKTNAGGKLIQGQIDLWAELESEIHVLDYKTGSSFYSEKAFEQLAFYTAALYTMKMISKNKKIIHSVVYPGEVLIKKLVFENYADFQKQLNPKIKELFE
ncbi:MAG: UvrD-helicase domain-containing protein [Bdellovibrionota bacterium]